MPRRRRPVLAPALVGVLAAAVLVAAAPPARAAEGASLSPIDAAHGVLAGLGIAAAGLVALVGVGCFAAVLGALLPRVAAAADRAARAGSATGPLLVGSLVVLGTLAVVAGAAQAGAAAAGVAFVVLGLPATALFLAGLSATLPLLGERLLGAGGAAASPLRRAVVGAGALGLAFLPTVLLQLHPLTFLLLMAALGWPVGVGLFAALARRRAAGTTSSPGTSATSPTAPA